MSNINSHSKTKGGKMPEYSLVQSFLSFTSLVPFSRYLFYPLTYFENPLQFATAIEQNDKTVEIAKGTKLVKN